MSLRDWLGDSRRLLLVVVAAPLALFLPVLLAGKAVFWGTPLLQFVPWWDLAWSQLREGQLPLWNPYSGMGAPLLANYQSALFYPPHWIYFLLHLLGGRPLMAWGMALLMAAHLACAGMGMAVLVRRLGSGQALTGGRRAGVWHVRLPGCSSRFPEHQRRCCLDAVDPAVPDSQKARGQDWQSSAPGPGGRPGNAAAGRARPDHLVHLAAGWHVGLVPGLDGNLCR